MLYIVHETKHKCSGDKPDFDTRNPLAAVMERVRKPSQGLVATEIFSSKKFGSLLSECDKLITILTTIIKKQKKRAAGINPQPSKFD